MSINIAKIMANIQKKTSQKYNVHDYFYFLQKENCLK